MEELDTKFDKQMAFMMFNDKNHFENHLNYLFRTDKRQKWTNEATENNYLIIIGKSPMLHAADDDTDYVILSFGDLEQRYIWKAIVYQLIKEKNLTISDLVYGVNYYNDENTYHVNNAMLAEMTGYLFQMYDSNKEDEDHKFVLAVSHEDQGDSLVHFHILKPDQEE